MSDDPLFPLIFRHNAWSAISTHKITPAKRDVITVAIDEKIKLDW